MLGKKHNFHLRGIYFNKFPSSRFWFSSGNKAKFTKPIWSCFSPIKQWQNMRFKSNFKYRLNVFQSQANQNVTDSKQTISNHMQAARCLFNTSNTITITCTSTINIITCKQTISNHMQAAAALIIVEPPIRGVKHGFSWCMTRVRTNVTLNVK